MTKLAPVVIVVALAACGGAIDNTDLYTKDQSSSGSSGRPAPTGSSTSSPAPSPTPTVLPPPPAPPAPACKVSFTKDVMAVFVQTNCANAACHGGELGRSAPTINPQDPKGTYAELSAFQLSNGQTYIVPNGVPKSSGLFCNLRGQCGVAMPIGDKLTSKQLDVVDAWLACGAPLN
jgi:hypothetical protein